MVKINKAKHINIAKNIFLPFFLYVFVISSFLILFSFKITNKNINNINIDNNSIQANELQDYNFSYNEPESKVNFNSLYTSSTAYALLSEGATTLPEEFCLYNLTYFNNNFRTQNKVTSGLPYHVENQAETNICWAFSSNTALETTLYKAYDSETNQKLVPQGTVLNFSELNLAYKTIVARGRKDYIDGGNFFLAYEYFSGEYGPVIEDTNEGSSSKSSTYWYRSTPSDYSYGSADPRATAFYYNNYYKNSNFTKSQYRAFESYRYPSSEYASTSNDATNLRNAIKNHIKTYGAVTSSIYYDSSSLYDGDGNGKKEYYKFTDPNAGTSQAQSPNHMVTLVGWDDDIGAYIAQNSYGTNYGQGGFFYLMYNDSLVEHNINGFTRVGKALNEEFSNTYNNMLGTAFENEFMYYPDSNKTFNTYVNYSLTNSPLYYVNFYKTQSNENGQYISRIKIPTSIYGNNLTKFNVYVISDLQETDIPNTITKAMLTQDKLVKNKFAKTSDPYLFTANQFDYYTIELDTQDTNSLFAVNNNTYFAIVLKYLSGGVVNLPNYDSSIIDSGTGHTKLTYQLNGTRWQEYKYADTTARSILPMVVQTQYNLREMNYTITDENQNLYNPATPFTFTYNGLPHGININVTKPASNYTIVYGLADGNYNLTTCPTFANAGTYTIYYKIEANFYTTVTGSVTIKINKKQLIVYPRSGQTKQYGDDDPFIRYDVKDASGNLIDTESLNIKFSGRLTRESLGSGASHESLGEYKISINDDRLGTPTLTLANEIDRNNYELALSTQPVYFTIVKRQLSLIINKIEKFYGDADPSLAITQNTFTILNTSRNETPKIVGNLVRTKDASKDASLNGQLDGIGLYDIESRVTLQSEGNFVETNYKIVSIESENKFEIKKRELIITPKVLSKIYLDPDPVFNQSTYEYSNNLNTTINGSTYIEIPKINGLLSREQGSNVGFYKYLLSGTNSALTLSDNGSFLAENYVLKIDNTRLFEIKNATILNENCIISNLVYNYNGQAHSLNASLSLPNDPNPASPTIQYSFNSPSTWVDNCSALNLINAGSYKIYIKFSKINYNDKIVETTLTINKANLVLIPNSLSQVYGDTEIPLTYTFAIDNMPFNIANETPVFSGNNPIIRDNGNDVKLNASGNLDGYLIKQNSAVTLVNSTDASNKFLSANYNYSVKTGSKYTITPRPLKIIPNAVEIYYGNTEPNIASNFVAVNDITAQIPKVVGNLYRVDSVNKSANTYKFMGNNLTLQDNGNFLAKNYSINFIDNVNFYVIKPAEITLTINATKNYYGELDSTTHNHLPLISVDKDADGNFKGQYNNENLHIETKCLVTNATAEGSYNITCKANNPNFKITFVLNSHTIEYRTYNIEYYAHGQQILTQQVKHFYKLTPSDFPQPETFLRQGHEFLYWEIVYDDDTFLKITDGYEIVGDESATTIKIKAKIEPIKYLITYNAYDGKFLAGEIEPKTTYTIKDKTFPLNTLTKTGYVFLGWFDNANFQGEAITKVSEGSYGNLTLYAKWQVLVYNISLPQRTSIYSLTAYSQTSQIEFGKDLTFKLELDKAYNQSYSTLSVVAKYTDANNNEISMELNPTNSKADFVEYTLSDIDQNYEIVLGNIHKNVYAINFVIDNNTVSTIYKEHGESLSKDIDTYPNIPEKVHFDTTQPYWSVEKIDFVSSNSNITAIYTPNTYVITFVLPNGEMHKEYVVYGNNVNTSFLNENYKLGTFDYFAFDSDISSISSNKIVKVSINSNIYILYICIAIVVVLAILITTLAILKKRRKAKFNWWIFARTHHDDKKVEKVPKSERKKITLNLNPANQKATPKLKSSPKISQLSQAQNLKLDYKKDKDKK